MKRGEVWTVAGGGDYTGKPRPAVIVQDDRFADTRSITICGFTTDPTDVPLVRPLVQPSDANGLREPSRLMADKLTTVPRERLGRRVGVLAAGDLAALNSALLLFLGLAAPVR
ncbi:MAG: type II toxin-antitoxin system PemK/MazF family toxin [Alphaproteobacteria bacterium]|nr:type II toxin-antitoxin system PemK/MazF family toxin [Alphaproteobacteria bacterium]MBV9904830.1 type II toxin-antitoxin system PemK/MazF family toxin [Alphaproteobacteria bacterium]